MVGWTRRNKDREKERRKFNKWLKTLTPEQLASLNQSMSDSDPVATGLLTVAVVSFLIGVIKIVTGL